MKVPSRKQMKRAGARTRVVPYRHRPGQFVLTASFRDPSIGPGTIEAVGSLARDFSQAEIARWLGCSAAKVGKIVRAYSYAHPTEFKS